MPRFNANLTMLFTEAPFLQRFARARKAGFEAVEFLFPYEFEKSAVKQALSENGLKQVLFNLPAGDWEAGERGLAILPDRVEEFRRGVACAIEYAEALGCRQINCLSGVVTQGHSVETLHATFIANLRYAAAELKKHGVKALIEPINHYDIPGFFLNTVEQADAVINEVGSDNLFIQYDLYHQQRTRGELIATYQRYKDRIAHIQLADNPGRNEPGTGEINYDFVFAALDVAGYEGWIGCEYKPKTTTEEGLVWLQRAEKTRAAQAGPRPSVRSDIQRSNPVRTIT